jgi:hypothetical protein
MENHHGGAEYSIPGTDKNLPVDHLTLAGTQMPVYPYLFALCSRSIEEAWNIQRDVVII